MTGATAMRFQFERFVVDSGARELRVDGRIVPIQPKALDLLLYMLGHRDRDVTKQELLEALWPDARVTESSLTRAMNLTRAALTEAGAGSQIIRTLRGRGYRFEAIVRVEAPALDHSALEDEGFVGRERELERLALGFEGAIEGRGQTCFIAGDPGIGKTRLAEAAAALANRLGAEVIWGRCYAGESDSPFRPWVEILTRWGRGRSEDVLSAMAGEGGAALGALIPEYAPTLDGRSRTGVLDSQRGRLSLFRAMAAFMKRAAALRPLVLVIDDLHWADPASLAFLRFFFQRIEDTPLLLLGTFRDAEVDTVEGWTELMEDVSRAPERCERMLLTGLDKAQLARLIQQGSPESLAEDQIERLHRRTEGNPFFVLELLALRGEGDEANPEAGVIPDSVRHVVLRRLRMQSAISRETLKVAAVAGRTFRLDILAIALQRPVSELLRDLESAEHERLVRATEEPGRLEFTHALIQETLYDELTIYARTDWHRRVGDALRTAHEGDPDPPLSDLAHHYSAAAVVDGVDEAVRWDRLAAGRAMNQMAFEQAAMHLGRALESLALAPPVAQQRRCEILLELADAQFRAGSPETADRTYRKVIEIARKLDLVEPFAQAVAGQTHRQIDNIGQVPEERVALLEQALEKLDSDSPTRARVLAALSADLYWTGQRERCLELSAQAIAIARRSGDDDVLARAIDHRLPLLVHPEDTQERRDLVDEEIRLSIARGDRDQEFFGHFRRIGHYHEAADREGLARAFAKCEELASLLGDANRHADLRASRACVALAQGRFEQSETQAMAAYAEIAESRSHEAGALSAAMFHYAARRTQGRFDELSGVLERGVSSYPSAVAFRCGLAYIYLATGQHSAARSQFEGLAQGDFEAVPLDFMYRPNIATLAETCFGLADHKRAGILREKLQPFAGSNMAMSVGVGLGPADRYLGLLCETLDEMELAIDYLEAGVALCQRMGFLAWEAYTARDLARCLRSRGQGEDASRATASHDHAERLARELGIDGFG